MKWLEKIAAAVLGSAITGGASLATSASMNRRSEKMMRESWVRDDSAVQRRTADLRAAGINPLMAAGQAATNSGPISLHSPEIPDFGGAFVAGKQAQTQAKAQEVQGRIGESTLKNMDAQRRILGLEEAQKANDLLLNIQRGTRSNDSGMFNQVVSSLVAAMNAWRKHSGPISEALSKNVLAPVKEFVADKVVAPVREDAVRKADLRSKKENPPTVKRSYKTDGTGAR